MQDKGKHTDLTLEMKMNSVSGLLLMLQSGFIVRVRPGVTVKEFLCELTGQGYDYVLDRVRTVLLDGRPVDDFEKAVLRDGAHLTLSAAMPGLVGMTLRRGSPLSSFRASITYRETGEEDAGTESYIHVKLFNLMLRELGPHFLRGGIFIEGKIFRDYLGNQGKGLRKECESLRVSGSRTDPLRLEDILPEEAEWLSLTATGKEG